MDLDSAAATEYVAAVKIFHRRAGGIEALDLAAAARALVDAGFQHIPIDSARIIVSPRFDGRLGKKGCAMVADKTEQTDQDEDV